MIPVGPFDLVEIIGHGGMGEVWSAVHRTSGVPAAVKVLGTRQLLAEDPGHVAVYLRAFEREVRAVARLRHPNIITVLDHGRVGDDAVEASRGALHADSPYLAMELASGGTLEQTRGAMPWSEQREILAAILDGLAHAHARGVIHRDLKPPNLLRCSVSDPEPGWKLADFGIAHALSATADQVRPGEATAGTPWYMAPEQFTATWRDLGPWTDLYGLGCVAWQLATGAPPWEGDFFEVMAGHTREPLPAFDPRVPVPGGLRDWLGHLLAKEPGDRFRWAAHARRALDELADPEGAFSTRIDASPLLSAPTKLLTPPPASAAPPATGGARARTSAGPRVEPELPATWRPPSPSAPRKLVDAGLGLFGLRPVPLVDRDAERGLLWRSLREVVRGGTHRIVTLRGGTGVGKTRLARWLHHLVRELGVAETLWVDHAPTDGPLTAWSQALATALGTSDLQGLELQDRVARVIGDEPESVASTSLAALIGGDAGERHFSSPTERQYALLRALARVGCGRPVVLTLDDVQWGDDSQALMRMLETGAERIDSPVLVVATEGSGGESPATRGTEAELSPLGVDDHAILVDELLPLEQSLAGRVARSTQGNPLFAMQLVADWVQQGQLSAGPAGFHAADGTELPVPASVHALWGARLAKVGVTDPHALELAAALGIDIDLDEWGRACAIAGADIPSNLVSRCVAADLLQTDNRGLRFHHSQFRDGLLARARARGQLQDHHAICARALAAVHPAPSARIQARIAVHYLRAGTPMEAGRPAVSAGRHWCETADYARARALLRQFVDAVDHVNEVQTEAQLLLGRLDRLDSELDQALERLRAAVTHADHEGWVHLSAEGRIETAITGLYRDRDTEAAHRLLSEARKLARDAGLDGILGRSWRGLAQLRLVSGDKRAAIPLLERALAAYQRAGDARGIAAAWSGLGWAHTTPEDAPRAIELFQAAADFGREHGYAYVIADAHNGQGEAHRLCGNLEEAERHYRRATRLHAMTGSIDVGALLNLGLVLMDQAKWDDARETLEKVWARLEQTGQGLWRGGTRLGLAVCASAQGRWEEATEHLDAVDAQVISRTPELADNAAMIERMARKAGRTELAEAAHRLRSAAL